MKANIIGISVKIAKTGGGEPGIFWFSFIFSAYDHFATVTAIGIYLILKFEAKHQPFQIQMHQKEVANKKFSP